MKTSLFGNSTGIGGYPAAFGGIGLATAALAPFQERVNSTTVALALLLVVLIVATIFGSRPALLAALLGVLSFNFFFLPPLYTFHIADSQNWAAFGAFLVTAIIAGQLSSYARRRAAESEERRREIERLYKELQAAFEQASETEALRRSEKLKSALLDAVTHDLRTPLTAIKASVTTLLESQDEREKLKLDAASRGEFLSVIDEETDRLNDFIGDMVELARIEAGSLSLRNEWSEVPEIIEAALRRAEPLLADFNVKILIEENLPLIRADSKALAEVLYNLLENAAKYSAGRTNIEISVKRAAAETLRFAVADEGRGIPSAMRERIFDKFFRLNQPEAEARATRGTGLGLAIAKGIVEAHGGEIWVDKGINQNGARFVFTVPVGDE